MMNTYKSSLLWKSGPLWRRFGFGEVIYSGVSADPVEPGADNKSPPQKGLPSGSFEGNPEDNREGHA